MENGRSHGMSMLYLFLIGGVVGAGAGLLLAPQSGTATRDAMRRRLRDTGTFARNIRDRVTRRGDGFRERAAQSLTKVATAISPGERAAS